MSHQKRLFHVLSVNIGAIQPCHRIAENYGRTSNTSSNDSWCFVIKIIGFLIRFPLSSCRHQIHFVLVSVYLSVNLMFIISWLYLEQNPGLVRSLHGTAIQITNSNITNQQTRKNTVLFMLTNHPSMIVKSRKKLFNFKLTEQQETFCCKAECLNYDVSFPFPSTLTPHPELHKTVWNCVTLG